MVLVGVRTLVVYTVMVPGARVCVAVFVVDGVGIARQEHALET